MSTSGRGRPGTGGRQPRPSLTSDTTAIDEIVAEHGDPQRDNPMGVSRMVWTPDPSGDIAVFNRLSGPEQAKGETAGTQVFANLKTAEALGLSVSHIIVTLRNSGGRKLDRRPDLLWAQEQILDRGLSKVLWRDTSRMFRRGSTSEAHYEFLMENGVSLYLTELNRAIDWDSEADWVYLITKGLSDRLELASIKKRTHGALVSRFLARGRGWPAAQPFGCRRDSEMFVEVDPVQWDIIKFVFVRFVELSRERRGGLRPLSAELKAQGVDLSPRHLAKILSDPMYVDGNWSVTYNKQRYACEPVRNLQDPIPGELFQEVQSLLALRAGPHKVTPEGTWLLNAVPFVHARCMDQRKAVHKSTPDTLLQPRLRARVYGKRTVEPCYSHQPWVPEGCARYTLSVAEVDRAVIDKLRELLETDELPQELEAARPTAPATVQILGASDEADIRNRLAALKRYREDMRKNVMDQIAGGTKIDPADYQTLTADVDQEIAELEARLRTKRELAPRPTTRAKSVTALKREARKLLSYETPEDPVTRIKRAAFVKAAVSSIIAHDSEDGVVLEIRGALIPPGANLRRRGSVIDAADLTLRGRGRELERIAANAEERRADSPTVSEVLPSRTLSEQAWRPGFFAATPQEKRVQALPDGGRPGEVDAVPAWVARVRISSPWRKGRDGRSPLTYESAVTSLADGLARHPHCAPLSLATQNRLVAADSTVPTPAQLATLCRRTRWTPADLRQEATERHWDALEPPLTAEERRIAWDSLRRRKLVGSARWELEDAVSALGRLLVERPELAPLGCRVHRGLDASERYPSYRAFQACCSRRGLRSPAGWEMAEQWAIDNAPPSRRATLVAARNAAAAGRKRRRWTFELVCDALVAALHRQPELFPLDTKRLRQLLATAPKRTVPSDGTIARYAALHGQSTAGLLAEVHRRYAGDVNPASTDDSAYAVLDTRDRLLGIYPSAAAARSVIPELRAARAKNDQALRLVAWGPATARTPATGLPTAQQAGAASPPPS